MSKRKASELRVLFLGDVVGKVGRRVLNSELPNLKEKYLPDIIIANGENAAGGVGLDIKTAKEIHKAGVDIITSGNHVWHRKEFYSYLDLNKDTVIRPANYPDGVNGGGVCERFLDDGFKVVIINLIGRVFMNDLVDCPFRKVDKILSTINDENSFIFVDFHAEATSEKLAMGYHLDGRVGAIVGTHTHVQTSDNRILPNGTAYITDVGMCGAYDSIIGVKKESVLERFKTGLPTRFDVAKGQPLISGVIITYQKQEKKSLSIQRIHNLY